MAAADNRAVGLLVPRGVELRQIHLEPDGRGQGLGDRFMSLAKQRQQDCLTLWTFPVNGPARPFYQRHGFAEAERIDGQGSATTSASPTSATSGVHGRSRFRLPC